MIKLELEVNEVNSILQVLGELPTKTNAHPLLVKILQQAEAQMPKKEEPATTSVVAAEATAEAGA